MAGARAKQSETNETSDGRVQRGARNHEAIVQAVYDLVRATHLPPSVEDIAVRAGVGARTVFRQFEDLDALYASLGERVERELYALVVPSPPTGVLDVDLRTLVARRARIFEHLTPFRRVARVVRHQSPALQEQDARTTRFFRAALESVVAPHLEGEASDNVLEALDTLLSFEAWDRLRGAQKLSVKRTEAVLIDAAIALTRAAQGARGRGLKR